MDAIASAGVLLFGLLLVPWVMTRSWGLGSRRLSWLAIGEFYGRNARLRNRSGRFVSMQHIRSVGPVKRSIIASVAMADVASLAFSATALTAVGLHDGQGGHTFAGAMVVVAGVSILCFSRVLPDTAAALLMFTAGVGLAAATSVATGSLAWLEVAGLTLTLLTPWPVGLLVFIASLASINATYGDPTGQGWPMTVEAWLVIVLTAVVVAFGLLIDAARASGLIMVMAAATLGMFLLILLAALAQA